MVRHQYDILIQDEHDALSRGSFDSPELSAGDAARRDINIRTRDDSGQAASGVASQPDALHVNTETTTANASADRRTRHPKKLPNNVVGWRDLPRKDQLLVITLARLSEPLTQTSLQVGIILTDNRDAVYPGSLANGLYRRICFISCDGVSDAEEIFLLSSPTVQYKIWCIGRDRASKALQRKPPTNSIYSRSYSPGCRHLRPSRCLAREFHRRSVLHSDVMGSHS
jgi:hypothetical protein